MKNQTDDSQLLHAIAEQDQRAFADFLQVHLQPILVFIKRYINNHAQAEDIAQEVFLRVWLHAKQWQAKSGSPRSWLFRITYNRCMDFFRQSKNARGISQDFPTPESPEQLLMAQDQQRRLRYALEHLPERQRFAVYLCAYQGLSNKEAAQALEISVEALESLLSRARKQLRNQVLSAGDSLTDARIINE